ncbi:MAG: DUF2169 domain-containing protein [Minicystis sp.]
MSAAVPADAWPVAIQSSGPVSSATVLYRHRGQLRLTAVVKATFALVADGIMERVAPEEIRRHDEHHDRDPRRSLRAASDLAPYKARADVVVTGFAHAPAGAENIAARVAIFRDRSAPLVDKALRVVGDRPPGSPAPRSFRRMPLVYERAFGGPSFRDNPVGTGLSAGRAPPNLVHAESPKQAVGFGPIAPTWPARAALLGRIDPATLTGPRIELRDDFDMGFFQTAPIDQQCGYLQGDEWIVLEHLHPTHAAVRARLPPSRPSGRVMGLPGHAQGVEIPFEADGLSIDTERGTVSLTWRGSVPVPEDLPLSAIHVLAGMETAAQSLVSPPASRPLESTIRMDDAVPSAPAPSSPLVRPPSAPSIANAPASWDQTLTLTQEPPRAPVAPFNLAEPRSAPPSSPAPFPGAPWSPGEPAPPPSAPPINRDFTVDLTPSSPAPSAGAAATALHGPSADSAGPPVPLSHTTGYLTPPDTAPEVPLAHTTDHHTAAPDHDLPEMLTGVVNDPKPAWSWAAPDPTEAEKLHPPPRPRPPEGPGVMDLLYRDFAFKTKR